VSSRAQHVDLIRLRLLRRGLLANTYNHLERNLVSDGNEGLDLSQSPLTLSNSVTLPLCCFFSPHHRKIRRPAAVPDLDYCAIRPAGASRLVFPFPARVSVAPHRSLCHPISRPDVPAGCKSRSTSPWSARWDSKCDTFAKGPDRKPPQSSRG